MHKMQEKKGEFSFTFMWCTRLVKILISNEYKNMIFFLNVGFVLSPEKNSNFRKKKALCFRKQKNAGLRVLWIVGG